MKPMRKASRQKEADWALEVFDRAPYITVSMTRPDGTPYGLPLSLARDGRSTFYFHCAGEGEKLDCLAANPVVSLSAVSKCSPCRARPSSASHSQNRLSANASLRSLHPVYEPMTGTFSGQPLIQRPHLRQSGWRKPSASLRLS